MAELITPLESGGQKRSLRTRFNRGYQTMTGSATMMSRQSKDRLPSFANMINVFLGPGSPGNPNVVKPSERPIATARSTKRKKSKDFDFRIRKLSNHS